MGTLVERTSRFTMLFKVDAVVSETVNRELTRHILTLPVQLRRTLTWDQGAELTQHLQFKIDTGVQVYFCDPKSPLAARHQREHQRDAASVLPLAHRHLR